MNKWLFYHFIVCICVLFAHKTYAQLPPNLPEQDCINAIPVCQNVFIQNNSYNGAGPDPDEINPAISCRTLGEINSVWYTFRIEQGGTLCFTITPNSPGTDYDWSLYNISNSSCDQISTRPELQILCSWEPVDEAAGCLGITGANGDTVGPCGRQRQPCINVLAGETYALYVSKFTNLDDGYILDLSASTATLFDDTPPSLVGAQPACGGVTVEFSENVLCNTVDPEDFTISGQGGTFGVSQVISSRCDGGNTFDNQYTLVIDPPLTAPGNYDVSIVGSISDFCNNPAEQTSVDVFLIPPPQSVINDQPPQCFETNLFSFDYAGTSDIATFFWDFGDTITAEIESPVHQYTGPGVKTVTLTVVDVNNCPDTSTLDITVHPKPLADFEADSAFCLFDTLNITNTSMVDSISRLTDYEWSFGDRVTSEEENPTHMYTEPGIYDLSLISITDVGCRDTTTSEVIVYPLPQVDFSVEENVCVYDSAHFVTLSTIRSDIANDVLEDRLWNFGDGGSVRGVEAPAHKYDTAGIYSVNLQVFSDKGCTDSLSQPIEIYDTPPPAITEDTVCFGKIALLETLPDSISGGIVEWYLASEDSVSFYTGELYRTEPVVEDQTFFVESISIQECISERIPITASVVLPAEGGIVVIDSVIEIPNAFLSLDLSPDILGVEYAWDFGDGTTSIADRPAHEYQFPGIYKISVEVVDVYGCEYSLEQAIEVRKDVRVLVPSAFSPNGDGVNDEFFIGHRLLSQFVIKIYNRKGNLIYESIDPDFKWDGTSEKDNSIMEGIYVFRLEALDVTGTQISKEGTITLIR